MAVFDEASHPGVAGASLSTQVQHCYQRRSHVPPPPSASMPFAQEKRRWVAAMKANENNRRVSSRLAKVWRPLRAADKEPLQRKVAEAVAVHRWKYPDYTNHPREAHRRKEQERVAKLVTSKLKNDSSCDKEQQPTTCMVAAHGRGGPKFQQQLHPPPLRPTPRSTHSATMSAARVSASGAGQGTEACMPTPTVPTTTKDPEEQVVPVNLAA
ncbi:transcription factor Sox-10 [Dermacentor silvarum]|uniref:transcription factor Sox-10 n=1 Tax=Dermacentor silvarum TaxID=543639 RepID=UPI00189961FD|nr:transcription factor Sox-10 [Dermacentor silvarum]